MTRDWQASIRCCLCSSVSCFETHLADTLDNFQTLVDDCLNRTNTQAQFVLYFTNRDTSINENAGFNLADVLIRYCRTQRSSTNIITDRLTTAAKASAPFKHS